MKISKELYRDIEQYLAKFLSAVPNVIQNSAKSGHFGSSLGKARKASRFKEASPCLTLMQVDCCEKAESPAPLPADLKQAVDMVDESFSQMLLRKIDESGITDVQCYQKAHVDRKLFSKIRSDVSYRPSKNTAIAFALALELSLDEAKELLLKAGFGLSRSSKFDIIIEYFIVNRRYNIDEINDALYVFDQMLIRT